MSQIYICADPVAGIIRVTSAGKLQQPFITTLDGEKMSCAVIREFQDENNEFITILDGNGLKTWTPDTLELYLFRAGDISERFGYCKLETFSNRDVLLNGKRCFLRGYIRGIVAHEHPNMTGGSLKDAAVKNVRQAKKYGFNLVRFHSTIPTEEFVEACDEEGLFIHMEIGFAYEFDAQGHKKNLAMDNTAWRQTIEKYRNHPSVAIFCIGNEMHKSGHQKEVHHLYALGKKLSPSKLIMDNSGWGEYDRPTADIYSQHIAYYFPFKHHEGMFKSNDCWRMNGSMYDTLLEENTSTEDVTVSIRKETVPLRPVLAHEAIHYIDIPDYEALNKKFDDFCASVGEDYLKKFDIKKPRYLTELPELVRKKGLTEKMPDYIKGSQVFKKMGIKVYLEKLRGSSLCGFEMLQFADCLKYENKNGVVDFFDDDKYIDPEWMRSFNDNAALIAEFQDEVHYYGKDISMKLLLSNFLPEPSIKGTCTVKVNGKAVWTAPDLALAGGLQLLAELTLNFPAGREAKCMKVTAGFDAEGLHLQNEWKLWLYPLPVLQVKPECDLHDNALQAFITSGNVPVSDHLFVTDRLTDNVFDRLREGKHVFLLYHRDLPGNTYYLPGALERFKPCIWDRGSNLGGMIYDSFMQKALGCERYFEEFMQNLLEGAYKVCLDDFPVKVREHICGIDKPVRDRMKGLQHGVKSFIAEDTLRNFSHLFTVKAGNGLLTVCTLLTENWKQTPVTGNFFAALLNNASSMNTDCAVDLETLKMYLQKVTVAGVRKEDVMNHFWEIDNKPVEDTLFWEQVGIDLSKLS